MPKKKKTKKTKKTKKPKKAKISNKLKPSLKSELYQEQMINQKLRKSKNSLLKSVYII